jgi:uncharacterized BrkB/YihY/UPF0761 family membrane protein
MSFEHESRLAEGTIKNYTKALTVVVLMCGIFGTLIFFFVFVYIFCNTNSSGASWLFP